MFRRLIKLLQAVLVLAAVLGLLYGIVTYGSWYLASLCTWEDDKHRSLTLGYSGPGLVEGHIRDRNGTNTHVMPGFPVLFSIASTKFVDETALRPDGTASLRLYWGEIIYDEHYRDERHVQDGGPIHFYKTTSKPPSK